LLASVESLRRSLDRLGYGMSCMAGWLFVACAFFVSFDVISRKFFGFSSQATVELTGYMLACGIAWGLAGALTTRSHIRVDLLVMRLPPRVRVYMHALALAFLAVLNFFLVWRCWAVVNDAWLFGARDSSAIRTPLIIPQGLWAFGITVFSLLAVVLLVEVILLLVLGRGERVDRLLGPRTLQEETAEALEAAGMARRS
jgi:TRAP-type C4-dicarboxylate transport system permease small subunit